MYNNMRMSKSIQFLLSLFLMVTFSVTTILFPYIAVAEAGQGRPAFTGKADQVDPPKNKGNATQDVTVAPPSDLPEKPGKAKIEIPSERTEYSQRFLNPNGTFTEEISAEPKFFKDKNKKLVPIENDIVSTINGLFKYKNKANKFDTYFADNGLVRYQNKDGWVEFQPVGAANTLSLVNKDKIKYFQPYADTDFEYTVQNKRLKEEIILSKYNGNNTFTFDVNTNGLTIKKDPESGLITLYNKKNQPVAQFDTPFMEDKAGEKSNNVTLELSQQAGKDVLVLTADANWLTDSKRKFPVIIDPSISNWDVVSDTFVSSAYPTTDFSAYTYLSSGLGWGNMRSYIRFMLPNLPSDAKITNAQMGFYQFQQDPVAATVDMYRVTSYWSASTTNWNNQPTTAAAPESSVNSASVNAYWYFDATQLVKDWYFLGNIIQQNYGVMLRHRDENGYLKLFNSVNSGNNTPVITINYTVDPIGTEDFRTYVDGVNVFNGNLVLGSTDTGIPGRGAFSFARTYNSRAIGDFGFGYGWTADTLTYIQPNSYGPVMLVDGDGTKHIFRRNTDGTYTPPPGIFLDLVRNANNTYTVTQMDGTKINYDVNGKITTIVDTNNNTTTFTYDPVTGRLSSVKDASNRATTFVYDTNDRLHSVTDPANRTTTYTYDANGDLTQVNTGGKIVKYGYTNHNLTSITDPRNNQVTYGYDTMNDRVTSITSNITVNGTSTPSTTTFSYSTNRTTVTNARNIQTLYDYDDEGKVNKITQDPTGENIVTSFGYDTDKNVNQVTDPKNGTYNYQYQQGKGNLLSETNSVAESVYYKYDGKNNPVQVTDPAGNISTAEYDTANNNTDNTDPILQSSASRYNQFGNPDWETTPISAADNFAYDPSLERDNDLDGWPDNWFSWAEYGNPAVFAWENTGKIGPHSVSISNPTTGDAVILNNRALSVDLVANPKTSYVISGYVKTQNLAQQSSYLEVDAYNSTGSWLGFVTSPKLGGTNDWTKLELVVNKDNLPAGTASIKFGFGASRTSGKAYFDGLQIETGTVGSAFNLVENSSMELDGNSDGMPDVWSGNGLNTLTDKLDTANKLVGSKAFKIVGAAGVNKSITQHINVSGDQNSKFTVSGWAYADNPDPSGGWWEVVARINYTDGAVDWSNANYFDATRSNEWQHVAAYVKPTKAFNSADVYYYFYNQRGNVWFDAARLQEGDNITGYGYDANNNYTTSVTSATGTISYGYDSYGNRNKITDVMGNVTDFNFDPLNRLTQVTQPTITVNGQPTRYVTGYGYDANGNRTTVTDANNHTTTYGYNEWNQVQSVTDAAYKTTNYGYDVLGRTTNVQYPDNSTVNFGYDNLDRITSLQGNKTGGSFNYSFNYDKNGNITSVVDVVKSQTTSYAFDADNKLTMVTEPGGSNKVSYGYDSLGQITSLTATVGANNYSTNYSYDSLGQLTQADAGSGNKATYAYDDNGNVISIINGNGVRTQYGYDYTNRLTKVSTFDANGNLMRSFAYSYDGNGDRTQVTMDGSVQGNVYYTYDTLNRLTSETLLDGSLLEYQYDAVGNRTVKKVTKGGSTVTTNYSYDAANQLTSVSGAVYSYDANGNMTGDGSRDFVYDAANRLKQVKNHSNGANIASFEYDANGRRTSMTTSTGTTYFHYNGDSTQVLYETDANNILKLRYTYNSANERISIIHNGFTYFYQYNGHGDVTGLTDSTGAIVATYDYDAWGNVVGTQTPDSIGDVNPYRYAGYRYDKETDLYYLNARYYWAGLGRFINRDKINSTNLYIYCDNNPVIYYDPTGLVTEIFVHEPADHTLGAMWGHVALRVNGTVYSFGRYGDTTLTVWGEGILQVGSYDGYRRYDRERPKHPKTWVYSLSLSSSEEQKIVQFYANKLKTASIYPWKDAALYSSKRYKLAEGYSTFSNNCTTLTAEAILYSFADWKKSVYRGYLNKIAPYTLKNSLDPGFPPTHNEVGGVTPMHL